MFGDVPFFAIKISDAMDVMFLLLNIASPDTRIPESWTTGALPLPPEPPPHAANAKIDVKTKVFFFFFLLCVVKKIDCQGNGDGIIFATIQSLGFRTIIKY